MVEWDSDYGAKDFENKQSNNLTKNGRLSVREEVEESGLIWKKMEVYIEYNMFDAKSLLRLLLDSWKWFIWISSIDMEWFYKHIA